MAASEKPDLSKIANRAPSVARMFLDRVAATPDAEAFRYPQNGGWERVTWRQVGERVHRIAAGLIALGVRPEDRVALQRITERDGLGSALESIAKSATVADDAVSADGEQIAFTTMRTQYPLLGSLRPRRS